MRAEYEKLLAALLSCLSVGSFLLLAQQIIPLVSPFILSFLGLYVAISMMLGVKSVYHERSSEGFDLTDPTVFENGVLVLRSRGDRCAAFFAFALPMRDVHTERARRTLTTLLKVLPHSSVLSTEITKRNECYASFYVKLEKSDVLQRTRELVDSILTGFRTMFGEKDVRLLCDDELLLHLALGVPGKIQRVARSNRHTAFLRTDVAKCWVSAVIITNIQADLLQALDRESNRNDETYRVIFAVKNQEQRRVALGSKLILIAANNRPQSDSRLLASRPTAARRMQASEIARKLGDVMTRNVLGDDEHYASFEKGADELLSFLALWSTVRSDTEFAGTHSERPHHTIIDVGEWRGVLFAHLEELGIEVERDVLVWTNGFPLRMDARVGLTLFKIVPSSSGDSAGLRWLVDQMVIAMAYEPALSLVLLLGSPSDASALREALMKMPVRERIRSVTSVVQLQALLLACRTQVERAIDSPVETVQKML